MKIYAGTSGFGYKEWKGKFYPEKISPGKMLEFYSARLPAVEINNTFYRMPRWEVAEAWAAEVPPGFRFTVKAPQTITHIKRLHGVGEETRYLLGALGGLGARLGAVLFQFPATFKFDLPLLKAFLRQLPAKTPCAFDFRSPTWLNQETFGLLGEKGFCLAQEDTDESPLRELSSTAPWGLVAEGGGTGLGESFCLLQARGRRGGRGAGARGALQRPVPGGRRRASVRVG